ncbi:MAG: hypothetical protein LRY61_08070 [Burkholderiaceae bacterium]|nr:hypothetical protein [Burkholderiaceae bacterium]MCD8517202.1 hypothetical protein [Burkholderiaceae bacterium]
MKLHISSALHLAFTKFVPPQTGADVVDGLHWVAKQFDRPSVIYVPDNHDYYGAEFSQTLARLRQTAHDLGIFLLDNDEVPLDDEKGNLVRFLGCTRWTDVCLFGEGRRTSYFIAASKRLSDFRLDALRYCLPKNLHFDPAWVIEV